MERRLLVAPCVNSIINDTEQASTGLNIIYIPLLKKDYKSLLDGQSGGAVQLFLVNKIF